MRIPWAQHKTTRRRRLLLSIGLVLIILVLFLCHDAMTSPGRLLDLLKALSLTLACFALANGWWLILVLRPRRKRDEWLYLYEQGLVHFEGTNDLGQVFRWTEVQEMWTLVTKTRYRSSTTASMRGYELRCGDGRSVECTKEYQNFLKLFKDIERGMAQTHLPRLIASYTRGQPVFFGRLSLHQSGIGLDNGSKWLPWHEVVSLSFSGWSISIKQQGHWGSWTSLDHYELPNGFVLYVFLLYLQPLHQFLLKGTIEIIL